MNGIFKLRLDFGIQFQTVYVKAASLGCAMRYVAAKYDCAVQCIGQEDPGHSFDLVAE